MALDQTYEDPAQSYGTPPFDGAVWDNDRQMWVKPGGGQDLYQNWDFPMTDTTPVAPPPPVVDPTVVGAGQVGTAGSLLAPWGGSYNFQHIGSGVPDTPQFHAPRYNKPSPFIGPTLQEAEQEPGYIHAVGEGKRAIEQSAAARGTLNTGGTLKDLFNYGDQAGAQNFQNVYNRKLGTYNTNVMTQNLQPYEFDYRAALDEFSPQMTGYLTQAAGNQRANEFNAAQDWNSYLQRYAEYRNQKLDNSGIITNFAGLL